MINNKCEHKWREHTSAGRQMDVGSISASFICEKCNREMLASEVFQLEALENQNKKIKHMNGFQKYVAIVAIAISFLALIVSILVLIFRK